MILNDKLYDTLRWVTQYLLPAFATLYFALSAIWGLPYTEEVVGTIALIGTFMGSLLGISTIKYNKEKKAEGYMSATEMNEGLPAPKGVMNVQSSTYDILKWVNMIGLPALGALYFGLGQIWGFPYGEQVVGTIAALTAFMGVFLGVSTKNFKKSSPV